jgi:hypothetical protein
MFFPAIPVKLFEPCRIPRDIELIKKMILGRSDNSILRIIIPSFIRKPIAIVVDSIIRNTRTFKEGIFGITDRVPMFWAAIGNR